MLDLRLFLIKVFLYIFCLVHFCIFILDLGLFLKIAFFYIFCLDPRKEVERTETATSYQKYSNTLRVFGNVYSRAFEIVYFI